MAEKNQLMLMADYNQLMNERMLNAASELSTEELHEDNGAFFKSVLLTLNHVMVGDILWLKRFADDKKPHQALLPLADIDRPSRLDELLYDNLESFSKQRSLLDKLIIDYCRELHENDLDEALEYLNYKGESHRKRLGDLILHVFLHQVHHRGQVTTLLSQKKIDFGATDLPEIIPDIA